MPKEKIILDTDLDTDCDDAGALAVLHNLAKAERAEILGIICSIPLEACARFASLVNRWYDRADLPLGKANVRLWEKNTQYQSYLEHRDNMGKKGTLYNQLVPDPDTSLENVKDATQLYRRLLAKAEDQSVTICSIGTLTVIADLLGSQGDEISPLSGRELVKTKVRKLVSMAIATYPSGRDGLNWRMDFAAAEYVTREWPSPIIVQPIGKKVLTGQRLIASTEEDNPVRKAYQHWLKGIGAANRPSWDQLTVLYSILGAGELFEERKKLGLSLDLEKGEYAWSDEAGTYERSVLEPKASSGEMAKCVEDWMISVPD